MMEMVDLQHSKLMTQQLMIQQMVAKQPLIRTKKNALKRMEQGW